MKLGYEEEKCPKTAKRNKEEAVQHLSLQEKQNRVMEAA